MQINDARTLLQDNHVDGAAMLIFTDGRNLDLDAPNGNAFSAWWRMAERRNPDKVIIYHREPGNTTAQIHLANFVGKERRTSDGRFKVYLADVFTLGETTLSWSEFANAGNPLQSPLRYLSR